MGVSSRFRLCSEFTITDSCPAFQRVVEHEVYQAILVRLALSPSNTGASNYPVEVCSCPSQCLRIH
jgi:hypothetical protein